MALPELPITGRDIMGGAITFQKRLGPTPTGKTAERRVRVTFPTVNVPVPVPHYLGKVPTSYMVVSVNKAARIYNDYPMACDRRTLVLKCDTAGTSAELIVR